MLTGVEGEAVARDKFHCKVPLKILAAPPRRTEILISRDDKAAAAF